MTYAEFIINSAGVPKKQHSILNICHDTKEGMYNVFGKWHGKRIFVVAPNYKQATESIKEKYNLCIPPRNSLIFSHSYKRRKYALLQGFLPGSSVVDVSAMYVKR